ncbi:MULTISPECIES: hypothetical protein [Pseudomonas syringae group]|uniref:Uncharacterized protein n=1 Tax=Pseudomonas lijiangensis TaxID=2995658 RepID=A0ABX8HTC5_9PSED|nr:MULTISPECIES: hypothetical protein [Pseudomonas syringae group]MBX8483668.1 hypothetical protein [Pseudomonas cichorii]MBX8502852.1 hypothetical protein [Pseudomonas lijiangensis]MBX8507795.1 hypothetical protein [Pseudomonas lijiangensis]MBX8589432.1 hypothetical protein [Pseudomonas cichorii]MBX8615868.1 hypothetical protein [Pseudomonas cichorii]
MRSNFETALNRNEFSDYFRGLKNYFSPDPDWGTQLHIRNWAGLCSFLKTHKTPDLILNNAFSKYLDTVTISLQDAEDLFENIGCYYYMRKKSPALSVNGFDLLLNLPDAQRQKTSETISFLRQELTRSNNTQKIELFNQDMERLISDGGPKDLENL